MRPDTEEAEVVGPRPRLPRGKTLLLVALFFAAFTISGTISAMASGANAEALGRLTALPNLALAVFLPWFVQRKSRRLGYGAAVLWCVLVPVLTFGMKGLAQSAGRITAREIEGLEVRTSTIIHPSLGFSMPNPGSRFELLETSAEMLAELEQAPNGYAWVLQDPEGEAFVISVVKTEGIVTEEFFSDFTNGIRASALEAPQVEILFEELNWSPDRAFEFQLRSGVDVAASRCLASSSTRQPGLVVCITTHSSSSAGDWMQGFRAGLVVQ